MSEERRQILNMLAEGKITSEQAERLLDALGEAPVVKTERGESKSKAKYLRVLVEPKEGREGDRVNIKIPLNIIRAGVKLGSILPKDAKNKVGEALTEKGFTIDLNELKADNIEQMLSALSEMSIDVDDENERVRITTE